jgi:hypothetical protein
MYGVVLFFTLSGFLLYRPFAGTIVRGQRLPSVGRYLGNRALRILPPTGRSSSFALSFSGPCCSVMRRMNS